jgi:hypothetical protein
MNPAELDQAFRDLETYDWGSSRGALLPIEEAIRAAGNDAESRRRLEERLLQAFPVARSESAREFILNKLAWVGGAKSAPVLADLLDDAPVADAARNALESLPQEASESAIRARLAKLEGAMLAGALQSLGILGDAEAVASLSRLLGDLNAQVAEAAARALARIATPAAGRALLTALGRSPVAAGKAAAHATLECADRLAAGGERRLARRMWQTLSSSDQPEPVHRAARRRLEEPRS